MNYTSTGDFDIEDVESPNDVIIGVLTISSDYFIHALRGGGIERHVVSGDDTILTITDDVKRQFRKIESYFEKLELLSVEIIKNNIEIEVSYIFNGIQQDIIIEVA